MALFTVKYQLKEVFKKSRWWNSQTVTVKDNQVTIVLNGETIVDADLSKYPDKFKVKEGHLCIAGHLMSRF